MNYKEALEMNESKAGLDLRDMELSDLLALIDEIPGWDYPLAEEAMTELARRAEIDVNEFFEESDKDYSDLWAAATEKLEESNAKKWVIIDDVTSASAVFDEIVIDAKDKDEAVGIATACWKKLAKSDQDRRDSYYLGLAPVNDGIVDLDEMTDVVVIK